MSDDEESVLYVMTHGLESPERCATPIYVTMNGPQLLKKGVAETIGPKGEEGQKLAFFIDQALDCGVSLYVCQPSLDLNDLSADDLIDGVKMIGGAAFNDMAMEARAVVTF